MHTRDFISRFIFIFLLLLYITFATEVYTDSTETVSKDKFVLITSGRRILTEIDPQAPILGIASRGKYFPLISQGGAWSKIVFKGRIGYIENNFVDVVEKKSSKLIIHDFVFFIIVLFAILFIIIIINIISKRDEIKSEWFSPTHIPKKILLIKKEDTPVKRYLTNNTTSLENCFTELGFSLKKSNNSKKATQLIFSYMPDAIVVDWNIGENAQAILEQILKAKSTVNNIFVLFYNVPEAYEVEKSTVISNSQYLSISFSDKDLFDIITPLIITGKQRHNIKKSVETSALQGSVQTGSLSEVFQFIDIAKKTGCLLVEEQKPTGIVYFNDGMINYAVSKQARGEKAIIEILNLSSGRFSFVLDKRPKSTNCNVPAFGILMQWTKESDEASGDRLR